jgi:hypothetical protein
MQIASEVSDYLEFKSLIDLGLQVHHSELDFDKVIVFSWIKEGLENGRKH